MNGSFIHAMHSHSHTDTQRRTHVRPVQRRTDSQIFPLLAPRPAGRCGFALFCAQISIASFYLNSNSGRNGIATAQIWRTDTRYRQWPMKKFIPSSKIDDFLIPAAAFPAPVRSLNSRQAKKIGR